MLLVSQEEQGGHTTATVGGDAVRRGRRPLPVVRAPRKQLHNASPSTVVPETLPVGVSVATIGLAAGCSDACRYELEGDERVEWRCDVADGYTVDVCAKVARSRGRSGVRLGGRHLGLVGVDNNRIVSESRRSACIDGFVDLGGEHAGCFGAGGGPLTLMLEFDNSFSFFRSKTIDVKLTKTCPTAVRNVVGDGHQAAPQPHPESPPNAMQGARLKLTSIDLGDESSNGATQASPGSLPNSWQGARAQLTSIDLGGESGSGATKTSPGSLPNGLQGERPQLMFGGESGSSAPKTSPGSLPHDLQRDRPQLALGGESGNGALNNLINEDVTRLGNAISEAIRLCPAPASAVLCHLRAAQESLDTLTTLSSGCAATSSW